MPSDVVRVPGRRARLALIVAVGLSVFGLGHSAPAGAQAAAPKTPAQSSSGETIDKVVAIVNDEQILLSEIQEQVALFLASQRIELKDSSQVASLQKQILDQLIDEKLIVDYATKQGITITNEQVDQKVDELLKELHDRFGSEEAFQEQLKKENLTVEGLRERYRNDVRKQLMAQRIVEREIRNKVKVTEADVDTFFQNNREKLPGKPSQYHLAHILVTPKADANRRAAARGKALEVIRQLQTGASWEDMVKRYSDDTSTKERGGDLGFVQEGEFDENFEAGVRDLKPGQLTDKPIETRFGYHVVKIAAREETRYRPLHILIRLSPTPADLAAAIDRAEKARAQAEKGADWAVLVNSYSDDVGTKDKGGDLGLVPVNALPPEYVETLDSLKVGQVSSVLEGPSGGFHIFKVLGKEQGGSYNIEEIRAQLTSELTKIKLSEEYDHWIASIRKKSFIEIKDDNLR